MNCLIQTGDPIWIPADSTLYYPDIKYPQKFQVFKAPICAWFVENIDEVWAKVLYENTYWSISKNNIFPYSQEQK
jgi:hypothetical protein